jgi:hypothetical protein
MTEPPPPPDEGGISRTGWAPLTLDGDWLWRWIAWHVPKRLVYWCVVRASAHASVKKNGLNLTNRNVLPELRVMEVLDKWKADGA